MELIAFIVAVALAIAAAFAGPDLGGRVLNGLRSFNARVAGKGLLHLAHFDHNVRPSRATRRAMAPKLRSVWMVSGESSIITMASFGGASLRGVGSKVNLKTVAMVAIAVAAVTAILLTDVHAGGLTVGMAFPKLKEKQEKLNAIRKDLKVVFDEAGPDMDMDKVTTIDGDSQAKVEWIRQKNQEAGDLSKEVADLEMLQRSADIADAFDDGGEPGAEPSRHDGFVDELFESDAIKNRAAKATATIMLPETRQLRSTREQMQNALFTTGAGWAPESTRDRRIDYAAQELPAVVDLVPMITTDQPLYKFMRETGFVNAAGETIEGGAYNEATLALTEAEEAIRKITVWIPVTDEQLEDVPSARAYVESRLRFMLEQRLDQRLLYGNPAAVPAQIRGFHNTAGINVQNGLDRDIPDVVLDAATKVRVIGQAVADGVVLHPYDFTRVRLQKTADGIYIWGHPSQVGPATLWGMPVVDSAQEVEGAGLTGGFATQSLLVVRRGVEVKVSDSHADFFINGKQAIRADFRAALVTIRPGAFTEMEQLGATTP